MTAILLLEEHLEFMLLVMILRADNTILQVGSGTFTADNTFIRTLIWLTPSNLGYKRANNYIQLFRCY